MSLYLTIALILGLLGIAGLVIGNLAHREPMKAFGGRILALALLWPIVVGGIVVWVVYCVACNSFDRTPRSFEHLLLGTKKPKTSRPVVIHQR